MTEVSPESRYATLCFCIAVPTLVLAFALATAGGGVAVVLSFVLLIGSVISAAIGCCAALRRHGVAAQIVALVMGGGLWLVVGGFLYLLIALSGSAD